MDLIEQNPDAVGFYKHLGFIVIARLSLDGQGNPFPLINIELSAV